MDQAMTNEYRPGRINPQKFGLWISMGSLIMMFGAFTSAYIVRHAAGNWLEFAIPPIFVWSTVTLLVSSICLQTSYYMFTKENKSLYRGMLITAFLLGVTFLILQYQGWMQLYAWGVDFKINPSASFFYLINIVHAAHVVAGLTTLIVALIHAFGLKFEVTEVRKNRFQLVLQFWHFLGFLWIYLYIFLLLTR
jgi:cytochrome c oxidase subunit 3